MTKKKVYPVIPIGTTVRNTMSGVEGIVDSKPFTYMSNGGHPLYYVIWPGAFGKPVRGLCAFKWLEIVVEVEAPDEERAIMEAGMARAESFANRFLYHFYLPHRVSWRRLYVRALS